ncbi:MAG: DUF4870 domain-containing protein [Anaerolineae bacterium]|nr:DUF4870 domain-containing protein [Anaerolineae bacterium]
MNQNRDYTDPFSGDSNPDAPAGSTDDTAISSRELDDATPIPVRIVRTHDDDPHASAEDSLRRAEAETRARDRVVREYQEKYYGAGDTTRKRLRAEELAADWPEHIRVRARINWKPEVRPVAGLSEDERLWAALAHASALLTVAVGMVTGGWGVLLMLFAPLVMYLMYRDRSDFIAFHALQAFALQLVGTVGWAMLLLVGVLVLGIAIVISAIASIILVGIPFLLIFVVLLVLFVPLSLVLPVGMVVLSILGALNTYNGNDYRYPVIARWIDRQLNGGDVVTM